MPADLRAGEVLRVSTVDARLVTVLGHPRVLAEAAVDALRRRVVTNRGGVDGVSAYEPLYGRHAEGAIALRQRHGQDLAPQLLDAVCRTAAGAGFVAIRFALLSGQLERAELLAAEVPAAELRRDHFVVDLTRSPESG